MILPDQKFLHKLVANKTALTDLFFCKKALISSNMISGSVILRSIIIEI